MLSAFRSQPAASQTSSQIFNPLSPVDKLKAQYVDYNLQDLDGPQAVIDKAVVRKNCKVMLDTVEALGTKWRAHVKTHKVGKYLRKQLTPSVSSRSGFQNSLCVSEGLSGYVLTKTRPLSSRSYKWGKHQKMFT